MNGPQVKPGFLITKKLGSSCEINLQTSFNNFNFTGEPIWHGFVGQVFPLSDGQVQCWHAGCLAQHLDQAAPVAHTGWKTRCEDGR